MAESEKSAREMADELLRTGRQVFFATAGYTVEQIAGFGDLAGVPDEKVNELLHSKTVQAIASLVGESAQKQHFEVRKLHGKKRKRGR